MPDPLGGQRVSRSQYLADALQNMQGQGEQTRTPGALGANLLASYLLQRGAEREQQRDLAAQEAQRAAIAEIITDPRERLLYESDPAAWAENVGYQYRPVTTAEGSITSIPGGDWRQAAPVIERFDDRFGIMDPLNPQAGAEYTEPRGITEAERIQRESAAADQALAQARLAQTGSQFEARLGLDRERLEFDRQRAAEDRDAEERARLAELAPTPEDIARQERAATAAQAAIDNTRGAIGRAREFIDATGQIAGMLPLNQQRVNLQGQIDAIQANLAFQALNEMRALSPTGGALGSITERELNLLGSTVAALNPDMSEDEFRRSLDTIEQSLARWQQAVEQGRSQQAAPQAPGAPRRRRWNPQTGDFE